MEVKRVDSGYWHARWNANQWIQWPCGRLATMADAFGWVTEAMVAEANAAAGRAAGRGEGEKCEECDHLASEHGPAGCTVRLDSAWTASGSKPCGCTRKGAGT